MEKLSRREFAEYLLNGLDVDVIGDILTEPLPQFLAVEYQMGGEAIWGYMGDTLEDSRKELESSDAEGVDYTLVFDLDNAKIYCPVTRIIEMREQTKAWDFKLPDEVHQ